ncbi:MAG: class I SAM-dependent methyltransferase [Thiocapsa sp.]|nr:class I SAM-dependent methyltransferase [Thiocapsa sp.]MCG6984955.1 class I SAM-dependent methyltransferase [Thiocapsa sp.]
MSDFEVGWLALRAEADNRARDADLVLPLRPCTQSAEPLPVLDLGCGTGSNLRFLAPLLEGHQHWLCVDTDPELLARVVPETKAWAEEGGYRWLVRAQSVVCARPPWQCSLETRRLDLAGSLSELPIGRSGLVTASALLDLVSEDWLARLVERCAEVHVPLLMALTYDGRVALEPELSLDRDMIEAVNAHQRRDKGFGPALGPAASIRLERLARSHGYRVEVRSSDWMIPPSERHLQAALIRGWCEAARRQTPSRATAILDWEAQRLVAVDSGCSRIRVGHRDVLAIPPHPYGQGIRTSLERCGPYRMRTSMSPLPAPAG